MRILNSDPMCGKMSFLSWASFSGSSVGSGSVPPVKGDVEKPSDYDGVVDTDLDHAGGWKMKLLQELKAAGFDVDGSRVSRT